MGTRKKEANRKLRQGKTGDGMANVKTKGENFYRSAKQARTLSMFNEGKAQRNAQGKITKAASYQSRDAPTARVEPNRKWFANSRVISQDALASFRAAVAERAADPYAVLLKTNKLPMGLIEDPSKKKTNNGVAEHATKVAVEAAPFGDTFGPKARRKRVKLGVGSVEGLAGEAERMVGAYEERREEMRLLSGELGSAGGGEEAAAGGGWDVSAGTIAQAREAIFSKGQSKRIWNELYKVIDSSDVVIHVLDARDPMGTRCRSVEKYIREEAPHKHLVFVLNKVDLIPTSVAATWVRNLSREHPTLAFHASIKNSFGKGSLINLLRQFSSLHSGRKQISVGFVGYPNTGKSSIINTLRRKRVCTVAPIPGETKVWQYITLMKRIYLIDCPGVVPPDASAADEDILLRGVVRVENVEHPAQYVVPLMRRVRRRHLERTYGVPVDEGLAADGAPEPDRRAADAKADRFLEAMARKAGRLLKGGEPDLDGAAKMIINDFLRGKVPWYMPPEGWEEREPGKKNKDQSEELVEGRRGRLGEMGIKRKRDDGEDDGDSVASDDSIGDVSVGSLELSDEDEGGVEIPDEEEDEDGKGSFAGFSSDEEEKVDS